jgi:hypothetical protein
VLYTSTVEENENGKKSKTKTNQSRTLGLNNPLPIFLFFLISIDVMLDPRVIPLAEFLTPLYRMAKKIYY